MAEIRAHLQAGPALRFFHAVHHASRNQPVAVRDEGPARGDDVSQLHALAAATELEHKALGVALAACLIIVAQACRGRSIPEGKASGDGWSMSACHDSLWAGVSVLFLTICDRHQPSPSTRRMPFHARDHHSSLRQAKRTAADSSARPC